MYLLEDLKLPVLHFNFAMIYIIDKMLVLLKNHLNCLKATIFKYFLKSIKDLKKILINFLQNK